MNENVEAAENAAELNKVFGELKGGNNLIKKRATAEEVVQGLYGIEAETLAKLFLGKREMKEILADLREPSREETFADAGKLEGQTAAKKRDVLIPILVGFAKNNDANIRVKVAYLLGERGDERALPALCRGTTEGLETEREKPGTYWVRYEFTKALGRLARNLENERDLRTVEDMIRAHPKPGQVSHCLRLVRRQLDKIRGGRSSWDDKASRPQPQRGRGENAALMVLKGPK